jgi:hypothetical protein
VKFEQDGSIDQLLNAEGIEFVTLDGASRVNIEREKVV